MAPPQMLAPLKAGLVLSFMMAILTAPAGAAPQ